MESGVKEEIDFDPSKDEIGELWEVRIGICRFASIRGSIRPVHATQGARGELSDSTDFILCVCASG